MERTAAVMKMLKLIQKREQLQEQRAKAQQKRETEMRQQLAQMRPTLLAAMSTGVQLPIHRSPRINIEHKEFSGKFED